MLVGAKYLCVCHEESYGSFEGEYQGEVAVRGGGPWNGGKTAPYVLELDSVEIP